MDTPAPDGRSRRRKRSISPSAPRSRAAGKRRKTAPEDPEDEKGFLCHFHVNDPVRHWRCAVCPFSRFADLTQHIERKHSMDHYCAICYVEFQTASDRDVHTRLDNCVKVAGPPPPPARIIFEQLQKQMQSQMPPRNRDLREKWYGLWDILFPNQQHPESPVAHGDWRNFLRAVRFAYLQLHPTASPVSSSAFLLVLEALERGTAVLNPPQDTFPYDFGINFDLDPPFPFPPFP